jgi:hypothetical protein
MVLLKFGHSKQAHIRDTLARLKSGDSLLMPMQVPHRWSVAQDSHCGAIHLYTPAGETEWAPVARSEDPKNQEARKAEFESSWVCKRFIQRVGIRWTPSRHLHADRQLRAYAHR